LACGPQDADFANPIVYDGVFSGARLADLLAWIDEYLTSGGGAVHSSSNSNAAAVASAMAAVAAEQSGKQEAVSSAATRQSAGSEVEVDTDGFDAAAAAAMDDEDQRGFAVVPKTDCPHLAQCLGSATADAFADAKCAFSVFFVSCPCSFTVSQHR
jgi:threonine dehydratase